jgi:hypothetical protein
MKYSTSRYYTVAKMAFNSKSSHHNHPRQTHSYNRVQKFTGLDRPRGLPEVGAPRIFRQSAHEDSKVVSPTHRPPLPQGRSLTLICYKRFTYKYIGRIKGKSRYQRSCGLKSAGARMQGLRVRIQPRVWTLVSVSRLVSVAAPASSSSLVHRSPT